MRIVYTDKFMQWFKPNNPELQTYEVKLNKAEIAVLKQAEVICDNAGELQTKALEQMNEVDDGRDNDYIWASIYLSSILETK